MLPLARPGKLVRLLTVIAVAAAALVMTGASGARAATAYGYPSPGTPTPGGYASVVTSRTIGPAGGTIGPLRAGGLLVTLRVPRGAFPFRLQVTLTAPNVAAIGNAGFPGYRAAGGVGVHITRNGSKYQGFFGKLVRLTMRAPSINWSSMVVAWYGTSWVRWMDSSARNGAASLGLEGDPDFAVLNWAGRGMHAGSTAWHGGSAGGQGITRGGPGGTPAAHLRGITARQWVQGMRSGAAAMHAGAGMTGQGTRTRPAGTSLLAGGKTRLAADTTAGSHGPLLAGGLLTVFLLLTGAGALTYARRRRSGAHRTDASRS
jgi:hypothetical protein